jgi:hypothetical protein
MPARDFQPGMARQPGELARRAREPAAFPVRVRGVRRQRKLLALIYAIRTVAIAGYIAVPVSPAGTLVFAAVMGFT